MIINVRHSGQLGDIVYAIPAMQALARRHGASHIALYVPSDNAAVYAPEMQHPGGAQMVSRALFDFFAPLLLAQPYVAAAHFVAPDQIPANAIDFDVIRGGGVNVLASNLKDCYFKAFALLAESPRAWLEPDGAPADAPPPYDIVIGRSLRFRNQAIDYGVLAQLKLRVAFVGLDSEFADFRARFPDMPIDHAPVRDARDICKLIARASLYIGNQSFVFSIAEALQVSRLLEVFEPVPNVSPSGGRSGQFLTTYGLVMLLADFFSRELAFPQGESGFKSECVYHV